MRCLILNYYFTHNWIYTTCKRLPQCFKNMFLSNRSVFKYSNRKVNNLYVVRCKSNIYQNSFKYLCVKLWNKLPEDLKSIKSYNKFKNSMFEYLVRNS